MSNSSDYGKILTLLNSKGETKTIENMPEYRGYAKMRLFLDKDLNPQTAHGINICLEETISCNKDDSKLLEKLEKLKPKKKEVKEPKQVKEETEIMEITDTDIICEEMFEDWDIIDSVATEVLLLEDHQTDNNIIEDIKPEEAIIPNFVKEDQFIKPNFVKEPITFGIDLSNRPTLQLISKYATKVGLNTSFFDEKEFGLVRIMYTSSNNELIEYCSDFVDTDSRYFPSPIIIPNYINGNILMNPTIPINTTDLQQYFAWKKNPLMYPEFTKSLENFIPEQLVVQINFNSNNEVKNIKDEDVLPLKNHLSDVLNLLEDAESTRGIRWEFKQYSSPEKFVLVPENMDPSGLIIYGANQNNLFVIDYSNNRKEKIKIISSEE